MAPDPGLSTGARHSGWWVLHGDGKALTSDDVVAPTERLTWPRTIGIGVQHVVAMFGATFLVPILTGFPPTTTLLFSGLGTMLFLVVTRNRLPSYLGSSFAFIAPVVAAKAGGGEGAALFGIVAVGLSLAAIGALVVWRGKTWIDALLPPAVSGVIVAIIGFNLAPAAKANVEQGPWLALATLTAVVLATFMLRGLLGRLGIFLGVVVGYVVAAVTGVVDLSALGSAGWVGIPPLTHPTNPVSDPAVWGVLPGFLPIVAVLIAENVGHVRGVAAMTDPSVNQMTGRALLGDGLATTLAGSFGGSGTTTYGENIGVMAATRVYSTAAYWVAGAAAVALGLSPKVGVLINSIPAGVIGGVTIALYGLIGVIGVKIWIDNRVDFTDPVNQFTAAVALIIGIADITVTIGDVTFNGIALGTVAALVIYHGGGALVRRRDAR